MPPAYLLLSSILFIIAASTCTATDTISAGRPLVVGDKLVSDNSKFALGFFQITGRTSSSGKTTTPRWYLGIWFNTVSKLTPAWVANRDSPLADGASSKLMVFDDGNLVIFNQTSQSVLWSSQANTTTNNTVAVLQNNGNLVLSDASNSSIIFWQSFDHMTDTFLPGGKIGRNKMTGLVYGIVSNKNSLDLAPGVYSGQPSSNLSNGHGQILLLWNSSATYWTSGQWNGQYFTNMPQMSARALFTYEVVSNDQEEYFTYRLKNDTLITRYVLDVSGQAKDMIWSDISEDWIAFNGHPGAQCDVYAFCGPFTICRVDMIPFCNCMKGFSIRSPDDWELGDQTEGCHRNIPLNCRGNQSVGGVKDRFYAISDVRFPDSARYVEVGSADECAQACLTDCSCYAYSYHGRCSVWDSKLLNVAQNYNGSGTNEGILYLRLSAKELENSPHKRRMIIGFVIAAAIFIALSLFAIVSMTMRRRRRQRLAIAPINSRVIVAFRHDELKHAKKNFSERLGGGSFGSVFKGVLPNRVVIAVKRLDGVRQGEKEFRAEVKSIGMVQHINLIKLIGFCCEGSKRLLVYEYTPNQSLDAHLFKDNQPVRLFGSRLISACFSLFSLTEPAQTKTSTNQPNRLNGTSFSWSTRYEIALGVARGLAYLHGECQEYIIHCDIKPQNILLDASFVPKISDFGMAKALARDFSRALTTMRGTIGYLAPEWIGGMPISSKVDVYSYGMVLLEIIFGRRNVREEYNSETSTTYFPVQVITKLLEGNMLCLVDHHIQNSVNLEEVERACRVACWCIQDHESDRPTMGQVVQILEGLLQVDIPPMPKILEAISGGTTSINT